MIPSNLIINADDFGLDQAISEGIVECAERGLINSVSVAPFTDQRQETLLSRLCQMQPAFKIGCHLCLFDAPPLLDSTPRPSRDQASPCGYRQFLKMYLLGRMPLDRIYLEWQAQIQRLIDLGVHHVRHLDSHQHMHLLPRLWRTARGLQREFGIPRIRVPYESIARALFHRFPFGVGMQCLARLRSGWRRRERFAGFLHSMNFTVEAMRPALEQVVAHPNRQFELMVHPGYPPQDRDSPFSSWSASWENEIRELEKLQRLYSGDSVRFQVRIARDTSTQTA